MILQITWECGVPVVDLQQSQVCLASDLALLILCWIRVLQNKRTVWDKSTGFRNIAHFLTPGIQSFCPLQQLCANV